MSMVSMLGKMVVAGLVAKGVGKMMSGGQGGGGGLGDALSGMLGGNSGGAGGLGSLLGGGAAGGGLGAILGSLAGGGAGAQQQQQGGGIGDILGSLMSGQNEPEALSPTEEQNHQAEILLKAMLYAARSDGEIDQAEQQKIVSHLGDITEEETAFVRQQMTAPMDIQGFINSVPRGMEQQVYLMSLTAIDLDSQKEAQYLHKLAQGLNISQQACNHIHQQVGAPTLYS